MTGVKAGKFFPDFGRSSRSGGMKSKGGRGWCISCIFTGISSKIPGVSLRFNEEREEGKKKGKKRRSGVEEAIQGKKNPGGGGGWMLRRVATGWKPSVFWTQILRSLEILPDFLGHGKVVSRWMQLSCPDLGNWFSFFLFFLFFPLPFHRPGLGDAPLWTLSFSLSLSIRVRIFFYRCCWLVSFIFALRQEGERFLR